jgi:hypothetical protein
MYFIEIMREGSDAWYRLPWGWWDHDTAAANAVKWLVEETGIRVVWVEEA